MSQVGGTLPNPAQTVTRTDRLGRPISLEYRLPERTRSVLYTGPPGLGKSLELDRAQELAKQPGWIGVRLNASNDEPLEYRFVRALTADLDNLRERHGRRNVRKLKKTLQKLTNNIRNVTHGAEVRYGVAPVQFIVKRQWDATPQDDLGATLSELADQLGELAERKGGRVLLMVDNIDVAGSRDTWALTELSAHLEKQGREVYLVGAGSEEAVSRLMAASGGMSHLPTTEVDRFDIREVGFLSAEELRPILTERFHQAGVAYQPQAIESLLNSANGNPTRLGGLAEKALLLARRDASPITTGLAEEAAVRLDLGNEELYQGQWNNCSAEAKDLLDKAAAQGPRGLSMPAETRAAGPEHWVGVDTARQELVARGLLREDGQRVTVANPAFRAWVRHRIGRADEIAEPAEATPEVTQPEVPHLTPRPTTGPSIFGTRQNPAHRVLRKDKFGRQLSLDKRPPEGNSVLFTGQPGAGTSRELDQTQALADRCGWTSLRINASPSEPLENRFVRAATADLGKYRKQHGKLATFLLKRKLGQVVNRTRNAIDGFEIRLGFHPFQFVAKRQWDEVPKDNVGKNLNDLADHLAQAARKQGKPIVLMVDNLDVATDRDLAAMAQLAAHLEENRLPVFLVGAGGPMTTTRLLKASGGKSGAETTILDRLDHREVRPMTDDELRSTLTEPLGQEIAWQPEAVDTLVRSANGSPSRMRDLAETAVQLVRPGSGLTTDVARAAIAQLNDQSGPLYKAQWRNCSAEEKAFFARVAEQGPQGLQMRAELQAAAPGRWQKLDEARQVLIARGMLREKGDQVTVADPGMHQWIQTRLGQSVANLGVASPTAPTQAATQSAAAEPARQPTIREYRGLKFTLNS